MPDRMEMLRDLSERATPGEWEIQDGCSWRRIGTYRGDGNVLCPTNHPHDRHPDLQANGGDTYANLRLIVGSVNFVRDLLSGTWPDQEAVERGADALWDHFCPGIRRIETDELFYREAFSAALTAALGLTVLEGERK